MRVEIRQKIERFLAEQYFCGATELNGAEIFYTVHTEMKRPYLKIMAYRNCVVVCTSPELRAKIKRLLRKKNRDEIFEIPFVYGQTIHFVPGKIFTMEEMQRNFPLEQDYESAVLFGKEISRMEGLTGFENAVAFDGNVTPTEMACIAEKDGEIVGAAGAAHTALEDVWEIGVDVLEEHRNAGLAAALVSQLTGELLARGIVPFYSASVTNIASQRLAGRCGYVPMWVDTFGTTLDGSSVYNEIVGELRLS